jgi:hypothetical protein
METPLTPEETRMADYLLGQMTAEERQAFEEWLLVHPQAQSEFEQLRTMLAELIDAFPQEVQPPKHLRRNLLQAAASLPSPSPSRSARQTWWPWATTAVFASVAALLIVQQISLQQQLAQLQLQLQQSRIQTALLQQPDLQQVRFTSTGKRSSASGFMLISHKEPEALLRLEHLPLAPTGKVYRLWAIVHDQRMNCGQFLPSSTGSVWITLSSDPILVSAPLDITLEPTSATHATGEPILTSRS